MADDHAQGVTTKLVEKLQSAPDAEAFGVMAYNEKSAILAALSAQSITPEGQPNKNPWDEADPLADLVGRFGAAMLDKLRAAEKKYGWGDGWMRDDWRADCQRQFREHVAKGDPRDVANYCAFMWHHGWPTVGHAEGGPANDDALRLKVATTDATRLATALWEKHYKTDFPDWKPDGRLVVLLAQISNMAHGLSRSPAASANEPSDEFVDAFLKAEGSFLYPYTAPRESGVPIECDITKEDADELNAEARAKFKETWRAAVASCRPSQPETGWRPIETAPRGAPGQRAERILLLLPDGRVVTGSASWSNVWGPKPGGGHVVVDVVFGGYSEEESGAYMPRKPTHWMPIPKLSSTEDR